MTDMKITRRTLLAKLSIFLGGLLASKQGTSASLTPKAAEGPFYPSPSMRFPDVDNDLVKVAGLVQESGGEVLSLIGTVIDKNGLPQEGVRVEIWQCDVNGKYLHTSDRQRVTYDKGFQGFGHDITDVEGRYRFRTIKPVQYPGRTPHIHVKLLSDNKELLTTQFYLKGHSGNDRDGLYRGMTAEQATSVSMDLVEVPEGLQATVNLIV